MRSVAVVATLAAALYLAQSAGWPATATAPPAEQAAPVRTYADYEVTWTWMDWVRYYLSR